LFPQEGNPVVTEGGIDLPQMQVWMVPIPPAGELADLEAIALLSGLAAGSAALRDEPFDQQGVAPQDGTSLSCIKKTATEISRHLKGRQINSIFIAFHKTGFK
jgi:hypothetical protein